MTMPFSASSSRSCSQRAVLLGHQFLGELADLLELLGRRQAVLG